MQKELLQNAHHQKNEKLLQINYYLENIIIKIKIRKRLKLKEINKKRLSEIRLLIKLMILLNKKTNLLKQLLIIISL